MKMIAARITISIGELQSGELQSCDLPLDLLALEAAGLSE